MLVKPDPSLYKLFTNSQLTNLIDGLRIHHEIPLQYTYFGEGAQIWNAYAERLMPESATNSINAASRLLCANYTYVDSLLAKYKRVNFVDITIGNVMPVRPFLEHLVENGKAVSYIGLDFSNDILDIAQKNIHKWFKDKVAFEGHQIDINYDRFNDYLRNTDPDSVNVIVYFGGTACNFETPETSFRVIHDSMRENDLFFYDDKLDSLTSRKFFDFSPEPRNENFVHVLSSRHRLLLDIFGIDNKDDFLYEVEMDFDPISRQRFVQVRLKQDIDILFEPPNEQNKSVHIGTGERIRLLHVWHQTAQDVYNLLDRTGFHALHASHTPDAQYLLTISRIKRA